MLPEKLVGSRDSSFCNVQLLSGSAQQNCRVSTLAVVFNNLCRHETVADSTNLCDQDHMTNKLFP